MQGASNENFMRCGRDRVADRPRRLRANAANEPDAGSENQDARGERGGQGARQGLSGIAAENPRRQGAGRSLGYGAQRYGPGRRQAEDPGKAADQDRQQRQLSPGSVRSEPSPKGFGK